MDGFIAIHRKILDWEWYCNPNVKIVFLHCLLKANFAEKKWQGETIKRGEFVTSIATLSGELGMTFQQVRTALDKLKTTNEITSRTTNKFTIITICNYDKYQVVESGKQQTKEQAEQQTNNKQITNKQQTNNNNIINNNNNNKDNNGTNNISSYISPQTDLFGEVDKPKKKKNKEDNFDIVAFLQSKGVTEQHIQDYLKVRKEKKAVNTLTAMQRIDTQIQLAHLSWDEAVVCCIEWDWKGFNHEWYIKKIQTQDNNGIYQSRQRQDSRRETPAPSRESISEDDWKF